MNPSEKTQMAFKYLLAINIIRGEDSTGALRVGKKAVGSQDWEVSYHKTILDSLSYLKTEEAHRFLDKPTLPIMMIGHARAATRGKISKENAHPFSFENVIGVHNGTIKKQFKDDDKYGTDSEAIYAFLNNHTLKETIEEIHGWTSAYVLVWVDKTNNTLNFIRNSDRPLALCYFDDKHGLMWSSDEEHLRKVVKNMEITTQGLNETSTTSFFTLKPHVHMQLTLGLPAMEARFLKCEVPEHPEYTQSTFPSRGGMVPHHGSASLFDDEENYMGTGEWVKDPLTGSWVEATDKTASSHQETPYKILGGKASIKPPKFNKTIPTSTRELTFRLMQGCACCGEIPDMSEKDNLYWYARDAFFCTNCQASSDFVASITENDQPF